MIEIQSILINDEIVNAKFACDLNKCKGICCCLEGGKGAPLAESEVPILENIFHKIKHKLSKSVLKIIEKNGLFEKSDDSLYINCVDDKDCIFVYYEGKVAKCIIEKAYYEGEVEWQKPISCHLYPIRIHDFGGEVLKYSKIIECEAARKNGNEQNINLVDFLELPLTMKYGKLWYDSLKNYSVSLRKK